MQFKEFRAHLVKSNEFMKKKYFVLLIVGVSLIGLITFALISASGPGISDYEYKIASICTLSRSSQHQVYIDCEGADRISSKVVKVGWNDDYLIAVTNPTTKRKYPENASNDYVLPDESIEYWWVRNLVTKEGIGPISEAEYLKTKVELSIPDIELISVDNAKKKGIWLYGDN